MSYFFNNVTVHLSKLNEYVYYANFTEHITENDEYFQKNYRFKLTKEEYELASKNEEAFILFLKQLDERKPKDRIDLFPTDNVEPLCDTIDDFHFEKHMKKVRERQLLENASIYYVLCHQHTPYISKEGYAYVYTTPPTLENKELYATRHEQLTLKELMYSFLGLGITKFYGNDTLYHCCDILKEKIIFNGGELCLSLLKEIQHQQSTNKSLHFQSTLFLCPIPIKGSASIHVSVKAQAFLRQKAIIQNYYIADPEKYTYLVQHHLDNFTSNNYPYYCCLSRTLSYQLTPADKTLSILLKNDGPKKILFAFTNLDLCIKSLGKEVGLGLFTYEEIKNLTDTATILINHPLF